MDELVKVEIEVTPEAAAALADEDRRRRVGAMISRMVQPRTAAEDPLLALFKETQHAAREAGLSEQDIDDELAAYNAEGRR